MPRTSPGHALPLGDRIGDCYRCRRPLFASELSLVYEDRHWRNVHRSCRYETDHRRKRRALEDG